MLFTDAGFLFKEIAHFLESSFIESYRTVLTVRNTDELGQFSCWLKCFGEIFTLTVRYHIICCAMYDKGSWDNCCWYRRWDCTVSPYPYCRRGYHLSAQLPVNGHPLRYCISPCGSCLPVRTSLLPHSHHCFLWYTVLDFPLYPRSLFLLFRFYTITSACHCRKMTARRETSNTYKLVSSPYLSALPRI